MFTCVFPRTFEWSLFDPGAVAQHQVFKDIEFPRAGAVRAQAASALRCHTRRRLSWTTDSPYCS
jgi:hypothetical protein